MGRYYLVLLGLTCAAMVACEASGRGGSGQPSARQPDTAAAVHDSGPDTKAGEPCLTNLDEGLAACKPDAAQRRLVLIRNTVLPEK